MGGSSRVFVLSENVRGMCAFVCVCVRVYACVCMHGGASASRARVRDPRSPQEREAGVKFPWGKRFPSLML